MLTRREQSRLQRTIFSFEPVSPCGVVYDVCPLTTLIDRHVHGRYGEGVPGALNANNELARSLLTSR